MLTFSNTIGLTLLQIQKNFPACHKQRKSYFIADYTNLLILLLQKSVQGIGDWRWMPRNGEATHRQDTLSVISLQHSTNLILLGRCKQSWPAASR